VEVHFVVPDLRRLDVVRSEALAVGLFEDERPVRGPLGLVDWRLCGAVSRMLQSGRLRGVPGERLLLPVHRRLAFDKLFVFGLGPRDEFDGARFDRVVEDMLRTLAAARVREPAMALPGRSGGWISPADAMERFLVIARSYSEHDEVTLVEDMDAQRVMAPLVERARRRARADEPSPP
jgi:hypothetical protein